MIYHQTRISLDELKKRLTPILKKYDVNKVYIFGSYVHGGFDFSSDYDLLVDGFTSKEGRESFIGHDRKIKEMWSEIEKALDREVDIILIHVTFNQRDRNAQQKEFRENVEKEKVFIYGK